MSDNWGDLNFKRRYWMEVTYRAQFATHSWVLVELYIKTAVLTISPSLFQVSKFYLASRRKFSFRFVGACIVSMKWNTKQAVPGSNLHTINVILFNSPAGLHLNAQCSHSDWNIAVCWNFFQARLQTVKQTSAYVSVLSDCLNSSFSLNDLLGQCSFVVEAVARRQCLATP